MKPRKTQDLKELSREELANLVAESQDTLANQKFQNELKQLQDTSYLRILRGDIARMKTLLKQENI
jgi:ribosomal protein L29